MEDDGSVATALASGGGGVLLYYKYLDLGEDGREAIRGWYEHACRSKGLRGRVRVALDGVNCTLGGDLGSLQRHVAEVRSHERIQGSDIDFKLSVSKGPRNSQAAMESGFTTLSVKGVKEVVSMGARGARLLPQDCGRHVSPREFHDMLRDEVGRLAKLKSSPEGYPDGSSSSPRDAGDASGEAGEGPDSPGFARTGAPEESDGVGVSDRANSVDDIEAVESPKDIVLLDVRNVYETNIGHFSADGIERLDPETRQFSDLPAWVDANAHRMRGKRVLMYCTGGVRCEKASALVRQACEAGSSSSETEVLQLAGGIERYLQAYPGEDRARGDGSNGDIEVEGGSRGESSHVEGGVVEEGERRRRVLSTRETEDIAGADGGVIDRRDDESFFRGKNFVFDERISVPELPTGGEVIGRCVLCRRPWDDYGNRARCCKCRMLVLVCDSCMNRRAPSAVMHGMSPEESETKGRTSVNGTHGEAQAARMPREAKAMGVLSSGGDVAPGLFGPPQSRGRHGAEGISSMSSSLSPSRTVTVRSSEETPADTKVASPPMLASEEAVASTAQVPEIRRVSPKSVSALVRPSSVSEGMPPGSSQTSASSATCGRRSLGTPGAPEGRIDLVSRPTGSVTIQNIVCGFCRQRR